MAINREHWRKRRDVNATRNRSVFIKSGNSPCVYSESFPGLCAPPKQLLLNEFGKSLNIYTNVRRGILQMRMRTLRVQNVKGNNVFSVSSRQTSYLRESQRRRLEVVKNRELAGASVFCMDIDAAEQKYLLCGASTGSVSIFDLDSCDFGDSKKPVFPMMHNHSVHRYLVTRCQWYPKDSSLFITSSMDRRIALWDTNRMQPLDQYSFKEVVVQTHWSTVPSSRPLIAVANLTSNIELIDPRAGEAIRNLRWKKESVSSVQWSSELEYLLLTGGKEGNASVWDISGKSHLKVLQANCGNAAHKTAIGGIKFSGDGLFVVTMSIDRVIRVWNAYNMELIKTIKLEKVLMPTPASNPTISFDIISLNNALYACVPHEDNVLVLELIEETNKKYLDNVSCYRNFSYLLRGHFQNVNACIFRGDIHQLVSCANDHNILIWNPQMDEVCPDTAKDVLTLLQQDEWSDDD